MYLFNFFSAKMINRILKNSNGFHTHITTGRQTNDKPTTKNNEKTVDTTQTKLGNCIMFVEEEKNKEPKKVAIQLNFYTVQW